MDYGVKINLLKLKSVGVLSVKGKNVTKKCVVIPIEDNYLFTSADESGKPKAVYMDLSAWELKNPKFEETHMIKQSLPKEVRENMSKEQLQAMPILGGLRALPNTRGDATATCNAPSVEFDNTDDLSF